MYGVISNQIERRRVTDQVVDKLISMIINGKYKLGDRIPPEHELMKQYGVGRSSLREAIGALSLMGVLTVRPGHGTFTTLSPEKFLAKPLSWGITAMGRDKVHTLIEARTIIEEAIAKLAAEKATEEEIAELRYHHAQLKSKRKRGKKLIQEDLAFHNSLAKASHNSMLIRFISELRGSMRHWMEQKVALFEIYEAVKQQHEEILQAIEEHDPEKAQTAMHNHLQYVGEKLTSILLKKQMASKILK